jgi:hypothetical protein
MYSLKPIELFHDLETRRIILPEGAPFDGKPVLIKIAAGVVEAYWVPLTRSGDSSGVDDDGWHWCCMDDQFTEELDSATHWCPLPTVGPTREEIAAELCAQDKELETLAAGDMKDNAEWQRHYKWYLRMKQPTIFSQATAEHRVINKIGFASRSLRDPK